MPPRKIQKETTAAMLSRSLLAAEDAVQPSFTTDGLLDELDLTSDYQDGRTLLDRLTNGRPTIVNRLKLGGTIRDIERLMTAVNEKYANSAQERIASTLGMVLTKHVLREQELCQVGRTLVNQCTRPDIIPPSVTDFVNQLPLPPYQGRIMQNYLPG